MGRDGSDWTRCGAETRTLALQEGVRGPLAPHHTQRAARGPRGLRGEAGGGAAPVPGCADYWVRLFAGRTPVTLCGGLWGRLLLLGVTPRSPCAYPTRRGRNRQWAGVPVWAPRSAARRARGATLCLHCRERCLEPLCEADGP